VDTGWRCVEIGLGQLVAGAHALALGGCNSRKTTTSERTTVLLDDVAVVRR
jgi:hypothetical protein